MDINEDETASVLSWNVTHRPAPETTRQEIYADLEKYCGLDTEGMRLIVDRLRSLCPNFDGNTPDGGGHG